LAATPARESTLAFLRNKLEKVRFALDSLLEGSGFEILGPAKVTCHKRGITGSSST